MTRRTLNWKFLLWFTVSLAILGGGVHTLHGFQVKRSARALLAQADRAEAGGRDETARDYLERYLLLRPDDVEALVQYARLVEGPGDDPVRRGQALRISRKIVRLAGERADVRRHLVDLAVQSEEYSEAEPHLEVLRRSAPDDGELLFLLGRCREAAGSFREAADFYEQARHQAPANVEAYTRLAALLRLRLGKPDQADRVMNAGPGRQEDDGLIARNGRSAAAFLARALYCRRFAVRGADPAADVARALALAPDDADVLLAAAESARGKGDLEAARGYLTHGLERHPLNAALYEAIAGLELQDGHTEEAVTYLRAGIDRQPKDRETAKLSLGLILADVLIQVNRPDDAQKVIDELLKGNIRPELVENLEARALVARGEWGRGARALEAVCPALSALPGFNEMAKRSLLLLGRCYERLGNADQRYDAYRRAVGIKLDPDPLEVPSRLALAAALADLNRIDEALEQYRIVLPKEPAAGFAVARLQILKNLRRAPEEQRWQEVEQTLDTLDKDLTGAARQSAAPQVALLRAETLAARGQIPPARRLLEQALNKSPTDVALWVALANLAGREGKPEATLAVLDDAQKKVGDRLELRLARVGYWASRRGDGAAKALDALERDAATLPDAERPRLWRDLAVAYAQIGEATRARKLWERLAERDPEDLNVWLLMFDHALGADDEEAARRALAEIRRIEGGDGPLGHYGQAVLLIRQARREPDNRGPLAEARGELERAAARRPSWSRVPLALGDVALLNGNVDRALQHYLKAVLELGNRDPSAVSRVLQLLTQRGRVADAAGLVRRLRDEHVPLSGEVQRLAAQVSLRSGDPARALELAQATVPADSKDPDALILLGQCQWAAGKPAEPTFRRAVALAGDSPKAWLALILYLAGTDQKAQAEEAIKKAGQALPRDRAPLVQAQGYDALGRRDEARPLYRKALEFHDDVPTRRAVATSLMQSGPLDPVKQDELKTHLEKIIALGGATADASWARRLLAMIVGLGGNPGQSRKALEILDLAETSDAVAANADDLRTKAKILAVQPSRSQRREAIATLEGLRDRRSGTPGDLFLLAQLYEADGDWARARERALELLSTRDKDPAALAFFVRGSLRHNRIDEAAAYLAKLEAVAPEAPATTELKARVLVARGKADEAVALVKAFARTADGARLGPAAALLEGLGQTGAAEELFREYAEHFRPRRPDAVLTLARFLGRHGKTREALDLVDGAWDTCPPEVVSNAGVVILNGSRDVAESSKTLERRLVAAAGAHPDTLALQFNLANLRILQGRYADAEAIYRGLIKRDQTMGTPLNNLAWLLAVRGGRNADEALALVGRAIERVGERPDLLDTRAIAHLAKGQSDAAVRELQDAVVASPSADRYFHLARAYQMGGRAADATQALRKAQDLGLSPDSLHPLERESYNQLLAALKQR